MGEECLHPPGKNLLSQNAEVSGLGLYTQISISDMQDNNQDLSSIMVFLDLGCIA